MACFRIFLRDSGATAMHWKYVVYCNFDPHERDELLHSACVCVCVCLLVDFLGYDMTCVVFEGLSRAFHTEIDIKDGPADKPASLQVHSNLTGVPSLHRR